MFHFSSSEKENKITEGSITQALMLLFFPILFGTFFQQLYNTADAIIVGQYAGKTALAAVGGTTGTLINLLVGFFMGLASGASVVIAQFYGAKDNKKVGQSVHTAVALSLSFGFLLMLIGFFLCPLILKAMHTPPDIYDLAVLYTRIYFMGIIPNLFYNMGAGILRAIGDSKRPLYFLIISCFFNIILDLIFVRVFAMSVAGAAIATILSQLLSAYLVFHALTKTKESYQLFVKEIKFTTPILKKMFYIGLPAGLQSSMYAISNVIIQSFINALGTNTIAAWTAYSKIDSLFWMMLGALGISMTTVIGQNYGARLMNRVRRCVRIGFRISIVLTIVTTTILYFTGPYICRLFTKDEAVLVLCTEIIHFLMPTFITYISIEILASTLRGVGDSIIPMCLTCGGVCALRLLWLFTVAISHPSLKTVMVSYPLTWAVTSILFIIYYNIVKKKKIVMN